MIARVLVRVCCMVSVWVFVALAASGDALAVGECIEGMTNVYDRECERVEIDSGQCTTRIEQTPPARWCCCNEGYTVETPPDEDPDEKPGKGDGGCASCRVGDRPSSTLSTVLFLSLGVSLLGWRHLRRKRWFEIHR